MVHDRRDIVNAIFLRRSNWMSVVCPARLLPKLEHRAPLPSCLVERRDMGEDMRHATPAGPRSRGTGRGAIGGSH